MKSLEVLEDRATVRLDMPDKTTTQQAQDAAADYLGSRGYVVLTLLGVGRAEDGKWRVTYRVRLLTRSDSTL